MTAAGGCFAGGVAASMANNKLKHYCVKDIACKEVKFYDVHVTVFRMQGWILKCVEIISENVRTSSEILQQLQDLSAQTQL